MGRCGASGSTPTRPTRWRRRCSCAPGAGWRDSRSDRSSPPGCTGSRSTRPSGGWRAAPPPRAEPDPDRDDPVVSLPGVAKLGPEAQSLDREFERTLDRALDQLPAEWRAAVVLRDIEGLSTRDAAEIAGVGEAAFKSRLHRGRMQLRALLEPYLELEEG